ncbi:MAG: radical SAM protein [Paludibacteraceae bacterium]|nr:radical SAM protein [Paludibacteraceae bacterium]
MKPKKITFVVPPYPNRVREYLMLPSIELCIIAQILQDNGHIVSLIDMKIDNMSISEGIDKIHNTSPDFVVIEDDTKCHCNSILIINELKDRLCDVKIGMRGEISSFIPLTTLERNKYLDFILRFDDDYSLLKVIDAYVNGNSLYEIPNIAYKDNRNMCIVTKTKSKSYDINTLPMPNRRLYDIDKYLKRDSETIVKSSRGCPGSCLFCIKTKFEKFQLFSVQRFCDEIEELLGMGFTSFFFADDTFSFSEKRVKEFYNEVKKRNLVFRWTSNMRICDIAESKIAMMKEIGAYRVFVGIETVNADTHKIINKHLNIDIIREKIAILHKYQMEFHASFILGNPGDTEADIDRTVQFVNEIRPTLVTYNLLKVFPGLDLFDNPDRYDIILEDKFWYEKDDWSCRAVAGTKQLPPKLLEELSKKCLFSFIIGNE